MCAYPTLIFQTRYPKLIFFYLAYYADFNFVETRNIAVFLSFWKVEYDEKGGHSFIQTQ